MFRRLMLKLTLINVAIIALIFVLVFSSIYFFMGKGLQWQSLQFMHLIANDLRQSGTTLSEEDFISSPTAKHGRWRGPARFRYYYLLTAPSNTIKERSPGIALSPGELKQLIQSATAYNRPMEVTLGGERYRLLKVQAKEKSMSWIVFLETKQERDILARLLVILLGVGAGGLTLTFVGSLFMARRAMEPIKNSWQRQRNFVADASHELRTPLAVIQTSLDIVKDNSKETVASQDKWLNNISAETRRMAKLVDDLLLLARVDSEQQLMQKSQFSLDEVINSAIASIEPLVQEKGLFLAKKIPPEVLYIGDESRIKQLVLILLDNALKHTPPGGKISIALCKYSSSIEIEVADTGEGIPPAEQDKIFQRFYRVDKARSRQEGGTGLGLAIAQWIVQGHDGTIKVESKPGQGTSFIINLPISSD